MAEIDWREPPALSAKYGSAEEKRQLIHALRKNPGKWARVKKNMRSQSAKVSWTRFDLEAVATPAESDPKLFDIYARAPEPGSQGKPRPAGPSPAKTKRTAPSAVPAAEASDLAREAEEEAAYAAHRADAPEPQVVVPGPPNDSEQTAEAKAATAAWKNRLKGGRRG